MALSRCNAIWWFHSDFCTKSNHVELAVMIYLFKVLGQDATYMEIVSGLHIAKKEQEATYGYQAVCI